MQRQAEAVVGKRQAELARRTKEAERLRRLEESKPGTEAKQRGPRRNVCAKRKSNG
jgi:hypothetical protein